MTLNTAHSVGLSGITIWIGIQNGGLAVELWGKNKHYNHHKLAMKPNTQVQQTSEMGNRYINELGKTASVSACKNKVVFEL